MVSIDSSIARPAEGLCLGGKVGGGERGHIAFARSALTGRGVGTCPAPDTVVSRSEVYWYGTPRDDDS